jgi:hypothetical protein
MKRVPISEAAALASVSLSVFRKHFYGQRLTPLLADFPAPCARGRKLLWLDADIERWLAAQSTFPAKSTRVAGELISCQSAALLPSRAPGRPRKSVRSLQD